MGQIEHKVSDLKSEKKKYLEIKKDLKLYDMFMQGASKKVNTSSNNKISASPDQY